MCRNPAPLKDPPEEEESSEEPEEGPLEEEDFYDSDAEDDEQREAHAQQLQQQQVARLRAREQREQRKALRKQAREEEERRELPVRQPAMYVREDLVEQHRLPLPPAVRVWALWGMDDGPALVIPHRAACCLVQAFRAKKLPSNASIRLFSVHACHCCQTPCPHVLLMQPLAWLPMWSPS